MTDPPTADHPGAQAPPLFTRQDVFSVLGALGAILTLAAAVMFYFGWRRSDAQARAMNIDVSLFGYSSQDYVLLSVSSLYIPLLVIAGLGLAFVAVHRLLASRLQPGALAASTRARAQLLIRVLMATSVAVAAACVLFSALAGERWAPWPVRPTARVVAPREWLVPLVLGTATLSGCYAWWLGRRFADSEGPSARSTWIVALSLALVAATVLLSGFWLLEEYASAKGRDYASDIAASVGRLPYAEVISSVPLDIEAPGVDEQPTLSSSQSPRYRTTGLRLLARSGGKVILIHDGWKPLTGTVIVVTDTDDLTWEFSR